jgi:hypothetical protein
VLGRRQMSTFGLGTEEIAGVLRGLLIRLHDRLPGKDVTLIAEFIDANELGLAPEQIADALWETSSHRRPTNGLTCSHSSAGCGWAAGFPER